MKSLGFLLVGLFCLFMIAGWVPHSWADVPTVTIQGPDEVKAGQPFSITFAIRHEGNNFIHHLSKLVIYVDGKEEKVWQYTWKAHPKQENWTISYELTLEQKVTVSAIATCNLHGPSKEASLPVAPSFSR